MPTPLPSFPTSSRIIQGGMGIGVSSWRLARAVALNGEIAVDCATSIDTVVVRELKVRDRSHRRRVLAEYPDQEIVRHLVNQYYVEGGRRPDAAYRLLPLHRF